MENILEDILCGQSLTFFSQNLELEEDRDHPGSCGGTDKDRADALAFLWSCI